MGTFTTLGLRANQVMDRLLIRRSHFETLRTYHSQLLHSHFLLKKVETTNIAFPSWAIHCKH